MDRILFYRGEPDAGGNHPVKPLHGFIARDDLHAHGMAGLLPTEANEGDVGSKKKNFLYIAAGCIPVDWIESHLPWVDHHVIQQALLLQTLLQQVRRLDDAELVRLVPPKDVHDRVLDVHNLLLGSQVRHGNRRGKLGRTKARKHNTLDGRSITHMPHKYLQCPTVKSPGWAANSQHQLSSQCSI
jgi:hypothetical protein